MKDWQIRLSEGNFHMWLHKRDSSSLFFDGAAKGNPRIVGVGGFIKNADGSIENRYAWGLGHSTNM